MPSAPPASNPAVPLTDSLELPPRHHVDQSNATLNGQQQPRSAEPQYQEQAGAVNRGMVDDGRARGRRSDSQGQHELHSTQIRRLSSGDPDPIRRPFVAYDPTLLKKQQRQRKASSPDLIGRRKVGPAANTGVSGSAVPSTVTPDRHASWSTSRPSSSSGSRGPAMSSLHSSTSSSSGKMPSAPNDSAYQISRIHPDSSNTYATPSNGTGQTAYHMAVSGTPMPNSRATPGQSAWSGTVPTSTTPVTTTPIGPQAAAPVQDPKDFTLEQMSESRTYIVAKAQAFGQQGGFFLVTALFDPLLHRFENDKLPTSDEALRRFAPDMMPVAGTRPKDFLMIWRMWVDWTEKELRIPTIPLVAPLIALFLLDKIVSMDDRTRLVQILDMYRQAAFDVMITLGGKSPEILLPQWNSDQWYECFAMLQTGQTSLFDWRCIREACGMGLTARATPAAPPQSSLMSGSAPPTVPMIAGPGFAPTIGAPPLAAPPPGAQYAPPPPAPAFSPPIPIPFAPGDARHYATQPQPPIYPMHHPSLVQMATAAHQYPQPAHPSSVRPPPAHVPQRAVSFSQGQHAKAPVIGEAGLRHSVPASSMATGGQSVPPRPTPGAAGAKSLPVSPQTSPRAQNARPLSSGSGLGRGSSSPMKEQQRQQRPPSPPAMSTMLSGFQAQPSASASSKATESASIGAEQLAGSVTPARTASSTTGQSKAPFATGSRGPSSSAAAPRSAPPTAGSFAQVVRGEALFAAKGALTATSGLSPTVPPSNTSGTFVLPRKEATAASLPAPQFAPIPLAQAASSSTASKTSPQTLGKRKRTVAETVEAWKRLATEKPLNSDAPLAASTGLAIRSPGALVTPSGQSSPAPIGRRRESAPVASPSGPVPATNKAVGSDGAHCRGSLSQPPSSDALQPRCRKMSKLKPAAQELKGISSPGDENMTDEGFDKVVGETLEAIRSFEQARTQFSAAWAATPARAGEAMPPIATIRHRAPRDVVSASPWRDGKQQVCPSKSASLDLEATFGDFLPLPACSSAVPASTIVPPLVRVSDPICAWRPFPVVGPNNQPPAFDLTYTAQPCPATGPLHDILALTPRLFLPWPKALTAISPTDATSSQSHLKSLETISRKRIDTEILEGRRPAQDGEEYAAKVRQYLFQLVYGAIKDGKMNGLGNLKAPRLAKATRKKVAQIMAEGGVSALTPADRLDAEVKSAANVSRPADASTLAQSTSTEKEGNPSSLVQGSSKTLPSTAALETSAERPVAANEKEKMTQISAASSLTNSPVVNSQLKLKSALKSHTGSPVRPVPMSPAASAPPATAPSSAAATPNASPAPSKARRPSLAALGSMSSPAVPGIAPGARPRAKSMGGRRVSTGPGVHPLAQIYAFAPDGLRQQLRELSADVRGVPSDSAAAVLAAAAKKIQPAARRALSMTASPRLASGKELAHPSPPLVPIPLAGETGSGDAQHSPADKGKQKSKEKQGSVEPSVPKKGSALGVLLDEEVVPDSAVPGSPVAGVSSASGPEGKLSAVAPARLGNGRDAIVVPDSAAPGSPVGSASKSTLSTPAPSRLVEKDGAAAMEVDSPDIPLASLAKGKQSAPVPHRSLLAETQTVDREKVISPDVSSAALAKGKQPAVEPAEDSEMTDATPVPAPSPSPPPSAGSSFASAFSSVARAAGGALASAARAFLPGSAATAAIELEADDEEPLSPTRTKATTPSTVPTSVESVEAPQAKTAAEEPLAGVATVVKAPSSLDAAVPKPNIPHPLSISSLPPFHIPVEPLRPCAVREIARSKAHWLKASEPYRPFGPFLS